MLCLHPDVVLTDTDDGVVLLHQGTGRFWQLNGTGGRVLRRLVDGEQPDAIAADLSSRHRVDVAVVTADVRSVLTHLLEAKLVVHS
jgi:hypothetical protein